MVFNLKNGYCKFVFIVILYERRNYGEKQGQFSGEEFREDYLEKYFKDESSKKIQIILDGTAGYSTSFLDEAFGGLARNYGVQKCLDRLEFISIEEPYLIDEIKKYMTGE